MDKLTKNKKEFNYYNIAGILGGLCFTCGFLAEFFIKLNSINIDDKTWFFGVGFPIIFGGLLMILNLYLNKSFA